MPLGPAFAPEFGEVGGVRVDGENHVTGMVADTDIGMHCNVIEELVARFHDSLGSVSSSVRNCA